MFVIYINKCVIFFKLIWLVCVIDILYNFDYFVVYCKLYYGFGVID